MDRVILNGKELTVEQIVQIARKGAPVDLDEKAFFMAGEARKIVVEKSDAGKQIYGLNTGLGGNKDSYVPPEHYHRFNERILFSHSVALPPYAPKDLVRATMACRLNGFLNAAAGIQPEALVLLRDMLNDGIHPRIPIKGSVGMSDLGNMAYLGLAMIGRGVVEYQGEEIQAKEALERCLLKPLTLGIKDGLPLVSSNAFSVAAGALLCQDTEMLLDMSDLLYAMEYEAMNISPVFLDINALNNHHHPGYRESLGRVRKYLAESTLWKGENNSLECALSHSSSCAIHGAVRDSLGYLKQQLPLYINSSDDCPVVLLEERDIISSSNFIITGLAIGFEMLDIAMAHLSKCTANRLLRLGNEKFSSLPRFLRPGSEVIAYSTLQKTISSLDGQISHLAAPASLHYLPTANEAEDHGCNTPYVMEKTKEILELMYLLLGTEAMHAAQAADVAGRVPTGCGTAYAYRIIRQAIPMLTDDDRDLGADVCRARDLIKNGEILPKK